MTESMRSLLPRTFGAFLGRFECSTAIQTQAIPAIMSGMDVLLCAPTASGKTEAYGAPCAELLLAERDSKGPELPSWLLVSPTRALANDLHRRLESRVDTVGLSLGRYTGEHKERGKNAWPKALVVTPESLDSLLARRAHVLAQVRRVVVDEIHVLDGSVRGDQLRILLHRLQGAAEHPVQRIAASATVDHAEDLAARYLRDAEVCIAKGDRKVKAKSFAGTTPAAVVKHLRQLAKAGLRKILIFVPSRRDVDELSQGLRGQAPFGDRVFAHHGSLSQSVRERTERQFHDAPAAVAVATTTLELGIDIGSVDYVLLCTPPASVASMMQRIGRGGRRGNTIRFGYAWRDSGEEFRFRVMGRAGIQGRYLEGPYGFRASVIVQQAICIAGGNGFVSAPRLRSVLPPDLTEWVGEPEVVELLQNMAEQGMLEPGRGGRYVLSEAMEARYERGSLHSNLADSGGMDVVDRLTGDVVGKLGGAPGSTGNVTLGGAGRKIVKESEGRLLTDASGQGEGVRYAAKGSPLTSLALGRAIAESLGASPQGMLLVKSQDSLRLVHGLGTLGGLYLAAYFDEAGMYMAGASPTAVTLNLPHLPGGGVGGGAAEWIDPGDAGMRAFLQRHRARLVRLAGMGPFQKVLPTELAETSLWHATGLLDVASFLATARFEGPLDLSEVDPAVLHL